MKLGERKRDMAGKHGIGYLVAASALPFLEC